MRRVVCSASRGCLRGVRRCTFPTYQYTDALVLSDELTDEERMVQESTEKYCRSSLMDRVNTEWRTGAPDPNIFKELGELGLLGAHIKGYGCAGLSSVSVGLIAREIERVDSSYRSSWSVQSSLVMHPINLFGTEEQKDHFLPRLASGELIGCFGLTEPNAGSDPMGMTTRAVDKGDHFVLNGTKMWITNSPWADVFIVWAKDEQGKVQGFILEKGMEGLSAPKIEGKVSLRASDTGYIVMENVAVPKNRQLQVTGIRGPFACLNSARYGIAWGAIGAGEFCLDYTLDYVLHRKQFGVPLASKQLVQSKLVDMHSELTLGLWAAYRCGRLKDEGKLSKEAVSLIKRNSTRKALEAARMCRDMLGGNGIVDENNIIRHMTNLETVYTYEGTFDIHTLILGRAMTGIPAF